MPSSTTSAAVPTTALNFDGVGNGFRGPQGTFTVNSAPPDTNLAVGPNHVVEIVNTDFAIFNKTGTVIYGPVQINTLWSGFGGMCQADNDGDPIAKYDSIADRWVISQFAITSPNPNYLVADGASSNQLAYWSFHTDWTNSANPPLTGPTTLAPAPFTLPCGAGGTCVPQSGTSQKLDTLGDRLMYRLAYRNFGDHEALVINRSVVAGSSVGIRWYELRTSGPNSLSIFQQAHTRLTPTIGGWAASPRTHW